MSLRRPCRAGIGYAVARRLAALGASLFLHQYAPHDRDQPWGEDPGGPQAVAHGVHDAVADPGAHVRWLQLDLALPGAPAQRERVTAQLIEAGLICRHAGRPG